MAAFTIRVQLHDGTNNDYAQLHDQMLARGAYRVIKADDGRWFRMPWGEYACELPVPANDVLDLAAAAVRAVGKSAEIFVTEAVRRAWLNLPPI